MAFGFPAYHTETIPYKSPNPQLFPSQINHTLLALNWQTTSTYSTPTGLEIKAQTKMSMSSWGELITISINPDSYTVRSQCSFPTYCFDFGRNKKMVKLFLKEIQNHLQVTSPQSPCPPPISTN